MKYKIVYHPHAVSSNIILLEYCSQQWTQRVLSCNVWSAKIRSV